LGAITNDEVLGCLFGLWAGAAALQDRGDGVRILVQIAEGMAFGLVIILFILIAIWPLWMNGGKR